MLVPVRTRTATLVCDTTCPKLLLMACYYNTWLCTNLICSTRRYNTMHDVWLWCYSTHTHTRTGAVLNTATPQLSSTLGVHQLELDGDSLPLILLLAWRDASIINSTVIFDSTTHSCTLAKGNLFNVQLSVDGLPTLGLFYLYGNTEGWLLCTATTTLLGPGAHQDGITLH